MNYRSSKALMEGWLLKKERKYEEYWIELNGTVLCYYTCKNLMDPTNFIGSINVTPTAKIQSKTKSDHYDFLIQMQDRRYEFRALDPLSREQWIQALRFVIEGRDSGTSSGRAHLSSDSLFDQPRVGLYEKRFSLPTSSLHMDKSSLPKPLSKSSMLKKQPSLEEGGASSLSFYHGNLGRSKAEAYLQNQSLGTFLLRDSETAPEPGHYVISTKACNRIKHHRVDLRHGFYVLADQEDRRFNTLMDAIVSFVSWNNQVRMRALDVNDVKENRTTSDGYLIPSDSCSNCTNIAARDLEEPTRAWKIGEEPCPPPTSSCDENVYHVPGQGILTKGDMSSPPKDILDPKRNAIIGSGDDSGASFSDKQTDPSPSSLATSDSISFGSYVNVGGRPVDLGQYIDMRSPCGSYDSRVSSSPQSDKNLGAKDYPAVFPPCDIYISPGTAVPRQRTDNSMTCIYQNAENAYHRPRSSRVAANEQRQRVPALSASAPIHVLVDSAGPVDSSSEYHVPSGAFVSSRNMSK